MFSSVNLLKMLIYRSKMQNDEMWAFFIGKSLICGREAFTSLLDFKTSSEIETMGTLYMRNG